MENIKQRVSESIALFDMDGTLFDYNKSLLRSLNDIRSPFEKEVFEEDLAHAEEFISRRRKLITQSRNFWENLEKFPLGWDVLELTQELNYKHMILTQCPKDKPEAASGKLLCLKRHFPEGIDYTLTRDKGLVYGKVLVDDFPGYIERWLEWRDNGLVIMPANFGNRNYHHQNVIRYDGKNLDEVRRALEIVKERKSGEPLKL